MLVSAFCIYLISVCLTGGTETKLGRNVSYCDRQIIAQLIRNGHIKSSCESSDYSIGCTGVI